VRSPCLPTPTTTGPARPEDAWTSAARAAEEAFGPVSILVNNAARAIVGTIEGLTPDAFREVLETTAERSTGVASLEDRD
jgi:NAD(P)-dependent dehydrogenase (short-subunit alcohol dehydrogenase family)